ncbi:MAG TPA: hypothetical protein VL402_10900 [Xanthobacteraceae bacterium]|jgi:hypothetical protein|nr:hypothetical protein [Xanthobacteraceae bacterium]
MFDQSKFELLAQKFISDFNAGQSARRPLPAATLARLKTIEDEMSQFLRDCDGSKSPRHRRLPRPGAR